VLHRILRQNLAANRADNVTVLRRTAAPLSGTTPLEETVDDLQFDQLSLLKVGENVSGVAVLAGAEETLWRLRPLLFIAADDVAELQAVTASSRAFGYRLLGDRSATVSTRTISIGVRTTFLVGRWRSLCWRFPRRSKSTCPFAIWTRRSEAMRVTRHED